MGIAEQAVKDVSKIIKNTHDLTALFSKSGEDNISVECLFTDIPDTIDISGIESQVRTQVRTITISTDGLSKVPGAGWSVEILGQNYLIFSPPEVNEILKLASYRIKKK